MSGVCPTVPERVRNTHSDDVPIRDQVDLPVPDASWNTCIGGVNTDVVVAPRPDGEVTTISVCCPSPGPAGPTGPAGEGVPIGGTTGQMLYKVDATDYNLEWNNGIPVGGTTGQVLAKTSDTDYDLSWADSGIGNVVWRGYWLEGIAYEDNDVVSYNNSSFVCNFPHTSTANDAPTPENSADPGGPEWDLLSAGSTEEEQSLLDNLFDGYLDWLGPIGEWGLAEWGSVIAIGAGLVWAGSDGKLGAGKLACRGALRAGHFGRR